MIKLAGKQGFTIVEMMVSLSIMTVLIGSGYVILATGQAAWTTADTQIELQDNLRKTIERVTKELRETGSDGVGAMQVTINNGGGVNNSDIVTFSMPIICEAGGLLIDANGDVANWGAPLTWGCTESTCMDADNDCGTVDYSNIEYQINANNQLLRNVLDPASNVVRQDVFASNITDFQATLSADQNVVTLTVTAFGNTDLNRPITTIESVSVLLRNRG